MRFIFLLLLILDRSFLIKKKVVLIFILFYFIVVLTHPLIPFIYKFKMNWNFLFKKKIIKNGDHRKCTFELLWMNVWKKLCKTISCLSFFLVTEVGLKFSICDLSPFQIFKLWVSFSNFLNSMTLREFLSIMTRSGSFYSWFCRYLK